MTANTGDPQSLDGATWDSPEEVIERFERDWCSGGRPELDEFLEATVKDRALLLPELVHADLEFRIKAGEPARVEEYLQRFPELAALNSICIDLVTAEFRLRRRSDSNLSAAHCADRFPSLREKLLRRLEAFENTAGDERALGGAVNGAPRIPGYEIEEELGRGSTGVVFRARDVALGRTVALKVLHAMSTAGEYERRRFLREGQTVARLQHQHIVQVFEVAEHQGLVYIALEFAGGGGLKSEIAGTLRPPREAAQIVATLAAGIAHAHGAGVIHRDLKPSNILLGDQGLLKIADFGVARLDQPGQTLTLAGEIIGSPSYMAPEQAMGNSATVGPEADIHALGAVFYELLTGRPPFRAATVLETLELVRHANPLAPRHLVPQVPRDLETICLKCLEKSAANRYRSAAELATDLKRFLEGYPIMARRASAIERVRRWSRRHPAMALLIAFVAVTSVAVPAALALHAQRLAAANAALAEKSIEAEQNLKLKEASAARAEMAARDSRVNQYVAVVRLAATYAVEGNFKPISELLGQWVPRSADDEDLRGFEWGVLWNHRPVVTRSISGESSRDYPRPVATNRGAYVASVREGRIAAVWDISLDPPHLLGTVPCTVGLYGAYRQALAIAPGVDALAACNESDVDLWELPTLRPLAKLPLGSESTCVDISPSGLFVAVAGVGALKVFERQTGRDVLALTDQAQLRTPLRVEFLDDESAVLIRDRDSPCLWSCRLAQPALLKVSEAQSYDEFALSRSGTLLAACFAGAVRVFDGTSGRWTSGFKGDAISADFSGDLRVAAGLSDGSVAIHDLRDGTAVLRLKWQAQRVNAVKWQADDSSLLTNTAGGELDVWRLPPDPRLRPTVTAAPPIAATWDGMLVALADRFGKVRLLDRAFASEGKLLVRSNRAVVDLGFSPQGGHLFVLDETGFSSWAIPANELQFAVPVPNASRFRLSPDGRFAALAHTGRRVSIRSAADGFETCAFAVSHSVQDLALTPDGRYCFVADATETITCWDTSQTPPVEFAFNAPHAVRHLALAPGRQCLWGVDGDGAVTEFDVANLSNPRVVRTAMLDLQQKIRRVDTLSDDRELFVVGEAAAGFVSTRNLRTTVAALPSQRGRGQAYPKHWLNASAAFQDGAFVVSGAGDVMLWDRKQFTLRWLPEASLRPVRSVAWFSAGRRLLVGSKSVERIRSLENNLRPGLQFIKKDIGGQAKPDEGAAGSVRSFDVATRRPVRAIEDLIIDSPQSLVDAAESSNVFVTGGEDGSVRIWDIETSRNLKRLFISRPAADVAATVSYFAPFINGHFREHEQHGEMLQGLALSRDGGKLAAVGHRGSVRAWNLPGGEDLCHAVLGNTNSASRPVFVAWTTHDRELVTTRGSQIVWIEADTGAIAMRIENPDGFVATAGVASVDGNLVATAHSDRTIRLWSSAERQPVGRFAGHVADVLSLAFSPDGRLLASGAADGVIKLWHLPTSSEVVELRRHHGPVYALRFSNDGTRLASAGDDELGRGEVLVWDGHIPGRHSTTVPDGVSHRADRTASEAPRTSQSGGKRRPP